MWCLTVVVVCVVTIVRSGNSKLLKSFNVPSDVCTSVLDSATQTFQIGDFLALRVNTNQKDRYFGPSQFQLYNWRTGQLHDKPIGQSQLFAFDETKDQPDGDLMFVTTFDLCSILPNINQGPKRVRRQLNDDFSLLESILNQEDSDASVASEDKVKMGDLALEDLQSLLQMKQFRAKLARARRIKQLRLSSFSDELRHRQMMQDMRRWIVALIGAMHTTPQTTTGSGTSTTTSALPKPTLGTLPSLDRRFHQEIFTLMRSLQGQFNNLTNRFENRLSVGRSPSAPNSSPDSWSPQFEQARHCPPVVMATFAHSQWTHENRYCGDRSARLRTVVFEYSVQAPQSTLPRLRPLRNVDGRTMATLLGYRGTVRSGSNNGHFVVVRPDLSCPNHNSGARPVFTSGFTVHDRVFVQSAPGRVRQYSSSAAHNADDDQLEWGLGELLNCYHTSAVFVKPLQWSRALRVLVDSKSGGDFDYYNMAQLDDRPKVVVNKATKDADHVTVADRKAINDYVVQVEPQALQAFAVVPTMSLQQSNHKTNNPDYLTVTLVCVGVVVLLYFYCMCCSVDTEETVPTNTDRKKLRKEQNKQRRKERRRRRQRRERKMADLDEGSEDAKAERKKSRKPLNKNKSGKKNERHSKSLKEIRSDSPVMSAKRESSRKSKKKKRNTEDKRLDEQRTQMEQAGDFVGPMVATLARDQVVVIDTNQLGGQIGQLYGSDEMANRIESMIDDSRVLARAIEIGEFQGLQSAQHSQQSACKQQTKPSVVGSSLVGQSVVEETQPTNVCVSQVSSTSPESNSASTALRQVLHRMRRSLYKSTVHESV